MNSVSQQMDIINKEFIISNTPPHETAERAVSENPISGPAINSAQRVH